MTTMIVEVQNSGDAKKIAAAVRQLKGVGKVMVQKGITLERIPGLPYTDEEKIASVRRAMEEIKDGARSYSIEEMRARHPRI